MLIAAKQYDYCSKGVYITRSPIKMFYCGASLWGLLLLLSAVVIIPGSCFLNPFCCEGFWQFQFYYLLVFCKR
jgi:hypothetical protein